MVLAEQGGIVLGGGPPAPRPLAGALRRRHACGLVRDDRGSQTLELALLLPVVAMILALVLQAGLAASELVIAQAVARDAVRVAAVDDDAAARTAAEAVAGSRALRLTVQPPAAARRGGDLVTATVELRSAVLARLGIEAWLPAEATMRVEGR